MSEAELVLLAREGDRAAFDILAARYAASAVTIALAMVGDADMAEDVAQEGLLNAWTRINRCRHPDRFGQWLAALVRNVARDHRAKHLRRHRLLLRWGRILHGRDPILPDRAIEVRESGAVLTRAIQALPNREREILLLHDLQGLDHGEIAGLLNIGAGTSRKGLSEARRKLRLTLNAEDIDG